MHNNMSVKGHRNELIVALFVFQFSFVLPLTIVIPFPIVVSVVTVFLIGYALLTKAIRFTGSLFWLFAIPLGMLIIKLPFEYYVPTEEGNVGKRMVVGFLTAGLSGLLIGTIRFNYEEFFRVAYKVAWCTFILIAFIPFTPMYELGEDVPINYMRYGYAMLPIVLLTFALICRGQRSFWNLVIFVVSLLMMVVFGARGAFVSFVLFAILVFLFSKEITSKKKFLLVLLAILFISILPLLLTKLSSFLEAVNIHSYSIDKYAEVLGGDSLEETSSGRDVLYLKAFDRILDFKLFGYPINTCYVDTKSFYYYHNIVLDLLVNYGVYITTCLLIFAIAFFFKIFSRCSYDALLITSLFFIIPMGRLMLSSSFWLRADFWFLLSFLIHNTSHMILPNERSLFS